MSFTQLIITKTEDNMYTAIVDGQFADKLTKDEALGVCAGALFGKAPPFIRSIETQTDCFMRHAKKMAEIALEKEIQAAAKENLRRDDLYA